MSRFTVRSAIVYRVNLLTMPGIFVIYVIRTKPSKVLATASHCLLLITMTRIKFSTRLSLKWLLECLAINVAIE